MEPKRPLMPNRLLKAAIDANVSDLTKLLGLDETQDQCSQSDLSTEDDKTPMNPHDCLRSTAGMGNTILHILSANGAHGEIVSTICKEDTSLLKVCNVRNETPFHHAARFGHALTISSLIGSANTEFGEDGLKELLRYQNCLGDTALHEAARHGHKMVVSVLMEADQELAGQVNNDFASPLYLATARSSLDVVKAMVDHMRAYQITPDFYSGPNKRTALHSAVLQQPELTKELLRLYSEPFGKRADDKGSTPLHFIALLGNHNLATLLLDKDSSLAYMQDLEGSFPVHIAARMGHAEMIALLLHRCPDSDVLLDHSGRNFLHIAIEANKLNVIFELLGSKNKIPVYPWRKRFNRMVNAIDNNGNTPLHIAAKNGSIAFMIARWNNKNLLNLTLPNKEGLTALDLSVLGLRTSNRKIKDSDLLSEFYTRFIVDHVSTGWFEHYIQDYMPKAELRSVDQVPKTELRGAIEEDILITNRSGAKTSLEIGMTKAQIVGLGSVLIATVTFAAAFTLPGGTNQDTGKAILGRNYFFKAFVLADFAAFFFSFLSTLILIYSSIGEKPDLVEEMVTMSMNIFTIAAKCMVIALALGMYVVLYPANKTAFVIFGFSCFLISFHNPYDGPLQYFTYIALWNLLLEHSGGANVANKLISIKTLKEVLYFFYKIYAPIVVPFILVFLFALV